MKDQTLLEQINLIDGHVNQIPVKSGNTVSSHDYDNKQLYFHKKNDDGKDAVYSIDYDGNVVKNTTLNASNVTAIAVFNGFLYTQSNEEKTISKINLTTGDVSQKILLPTPFFQLTELAIIDTYLYQTGKQVD